MTIALNIRMPNSLNLMRGHIDNFFRAMIHKLDVNSHKKTPDVEDLPQIVSRLRQEIEEFEEQVASDRLNGNSILELADIANFALLAAVVLMREGADWRDLRRG